MAVITERFSVSTKGFTDIVNITTPIQNIIKNKGISDGQLLVYISGSTASITNIEYEPGLIKDLPEVLDIFAPENKFYHHDEKWHDGNGYAHIRASIIGNSELYPIVNNQVVLGTWQQIVLIDFDNKPRTRSVVTQINY